MSSAITSNAAAITALATEYQRLLKRTSSIGLTKKVQNPGDTMTAVIAAIVVSGTCRMLRSCGTEIKMMPPYMPKTELVRPISHIGATNLGVIVTFSESMDGATQPLDYSEATKLPRTDVRRQHHVAPPLVSSVVLLDSHWDRLRRIERIPSP